MAQAAEHHATMQKIGMGSREPVVVLDFLMVISGNRIAPQLAAVDPSRLIYQADPVSDVAAADEYMPLDALATMYLDTLRDAAGTGDPITVVAFCAAAALGVRLAQLLKQHTAVTTVLVRPFSPDGEMIAQEYAALRSGLGADADGPGLDLRAAPDALLASMMKQIDQDLRAAAERHNLHATDDVFVELRERYRGWLGFLVSTAAALGWQQMTDVSPIVVVCERESAEVPGSDPGTYPVVELPVPEGDIAVSEELARLVMTTEPTIQRNRRPSCPSDR